MPSRDKQCLRGIGSDFVDIQAFRSNVRPLDLPETRPGLRLSNAAAPVPKSPLHASGLMLLSVLLFSGMNICIRLAADAGLDSMQVAFFRNFFGLIFALPLLYQHGFILLKTERLGMYFIRCFIGLCAMQTGFWALVHLPMSQAIAISYTTPLFVTVGAVWFLGETVRARRWSAVFVGFLGALVILKVWTFGASWLDSGVWIALLSAIFSAAAAINIKFLSRTEKAEAVVFYMVLIMTPLSLPMALSVWQNPSPSAWLWVVLTGAFGTAAHIALTRAYQLGDVSTLTPINFVQLPVIALAAWMLFGESPDRYAVIGAIIVFSSVIYIAHREAVLGKRSVAAITDEKIRPDR
jgi:drug/metabolite transporter (DMT)-like permease